jgi:hypothetical protein
MIRRLDFRFLQPALLPQPVESPPGNPAVVPVLLRNPAAQVSDLQDQQAKPRPVSGEFQDSQKQS